MAENKTVRTIHGVSVLFPCRPYPSQMSMMEKIIKGIERRENCLLESPTGSGKSLALLCAALAWQRAEYDKAEKEALEESKKVCNCNKTDVKPPQPKPVPNGVKGDSHDDHHDVGNKQETIESSLSHASPDDDDFKPNASFRTPNGATQSFPQPAPAQPQQFLSFQINASQTLLVPTQTIVPQPVAPAVVNQGGCDGHITENKKVPEAVIKLDNASGDGQPCCKCYTHPQTRRKVPKIYFGTRTHKQITQIVRELKKTDYAHARMSILASREHTCIHPGVSTHASKTEGCKELLDGPGCLFHSNVRKFAFQANVQDYLDTAWDIEDMVKLCSSRKVKACPYFSTRALRSEADIVFCPYNYLVSPLIRKSLEISLKDQIVIFDEAHNIENSACEEMCRSVNQDELQKAVKELTDLINNEVKPQEHSVLKNICVNMERFITTSAPTLQPRSFSESSRVWHGYDIVAAFNDLGIGPQHHPHIQHCFNEVSSDEDGGKRDGPPDRKKKATPKLSQASLRMLDNVISVLEYMYRRDLRFLHDFKVALLKSTVYGSAPDASGSWLNSKKKKVPTATLR